MTTLAQRRPAGNALHASTRRADAAARVRQGAAEAPRQYLAFRLGDEMFAIGILNGKEIIAYGQLTAIPMLPAFIRGVINLRGAVIPVVDLAARFGRTRSVADKRSCIVILEASESDFQQDVGMMVDTVSEVLEIPAGDIEPSPSFGARIRADFMHGMGKVDGTFVILLDTAKVLSTDEMAMLAAAARNHQG